MRESERFPVSESTTKCLNPKVGFTSDHQQGWFQKGESSFRGGNKNFLNGTTTFFFTNFPEECREQDLWEILFKWGSVREVYIPPKGDKLSSLVRDLVLLGLWV